MARISTCSEKENSLTPHNLHLHVNNTRLFHVLTRISRSQVLRARVSVLLTPGIRAAEYLQL